MEEHAIIYTQNYQQFKTELDYELNRAANSFVRIGYLLKQARDTDILKESPYESYTEFARTEYHLEESQVSRFIAISERFSKPENPEELRDDFKEYGVAKLGIMLTLPDHVNDQLSPDMTKAEITAIAEEVREEEKITPIERMVEDPGETAEMGYLEKILFEIGKAEPKMMAEILREEGFTLKPDESKIMKTMAPTGTKLYMVRIPGMGRITLNVRNGFATATNMVTSERQEFSKDDIGEALALLMDRVIEKTDNEIKDSEEIWERLYGEEFPRNAPVQKKESKVSVAKPAKKTTEKKPEAAKTDKNRQESAKNDKEQQKPTADDIMNEPEDAIPAAEEEDEEQKSSWINKETIRGYKAGLTADINALKRMNDEKQYKAMRTKLEKMLQTVKLIIDIEEEADGKDNQVP
ncbi:MAG: hypothetical protein IK115_07800 [Lachnospiraceae bacterium]|nr:hypothetical protein [Lachnospiraceae bacterium]